MSAENNSGKIEKSNIMQNEEIFHDQWAYTIRIDELMVEEPFDACTSPENRMILNRLGDIKGKKILELGCGAGEASVYFAKKGADMTATDISSRMLEVVRKLAFKHNVTVATHQAYSHALNFADETFDIVYAANLLHHVDIEPTLKEVRRVLKTGGVFVSWDPLAHNPLINFYRRIATSVRTEDEHPIKMEELKVFKKYFKSVEFETTWFLTLWIFIKYYFIDRIDPNKERYWRKILSDHKRIEKTYKRLENIDRHLLALFAFLGRYCWNIVLFCVK